MATTTKALARGAFATSSTTLYTVVKRESHTDKAAVQAAVAILTLVLIKAVEQVLDKETTAVMVITLVIITAVEAEAARAQLVVTVQQLLAARAARVVLIQ
jgi:hypothetical protein